MENNFTMETYRQDQDFLIDMKGTFDGASAFALIEEIGRRIGDQNNSVYVETTDISKVYSFGQSILASNIPKTVRKSVCFCGAMAEQIAPKGCAIEDSPLKQGCHKCTGDCKNCPCSQSGKNRSQA